MKMFRTFALALALAAIVPLASCATFARVSGQEQAATYDERALVTVELAYSFVLSTVTAAAQAGAFDRDEAAQVEAALVRVNAVVVRARALYDAGNAVDAAVATRDAVAQVAAFTALLEQLGVLKRASGSPV